MKRTARLFAPLSALLAALTLPVPATALSCLPPDPFRTLDETRAAPQGYMIALGTITFAQSKLPASNHQTPPPAETAVPARFKGKAMSANGFHAPLDIRLTLNARCFAGWCGSLPSGTQVLAFIERGPSGDQLTIDPCGGHAFPNPDLGMVLNLHACAVKGQCK